jgi:hypothetical protein
MIKNDEVEFLLQKYVETGNSGLKQRNGVCFLRRNYQRLMRDQNARESDEYCQTTEQIG